jgi:hypothetical protein
MVLYKILDQNQRYYIKDYFFGNNIIDVKLIFPDIMTITLNQANDFMNDFIQLFEECMNYQEWTKNNNTKTIVDNKSNVFGKYYLFNGDIYIGKLTGNIQQGLGLYSWTTGGKYIGFWNNNKMDGIGLYIRNDGSFQYGYWSNNNMHEICVCCYSESIKNYNMINEKYYYEEWNQNIKIYQKEIRKNYKLNDQRIQNIYSDIEISFME